MRKPQKSSPSACAGSRDDRLGEGVGDPGNDLLERAVPVLGGAAAQAADVRPRRRRRARDRRSAAPAGAPRHSPWPRSRYLVVTMLRIGPTFWAMPPCTRTRLAASVLERRESAPVRSVRRRPSPVRGRIEQAVSGQESAPADAPFRVGLARRRLPRISLMPGKIPPESCQPPPEPPSHSPRIARATTTRASSRSSGPVRLRVWPVARINIAISEASRLVETASREPLGMSLTLLTTSSPCPGRTTAPASRRA